MAWPRRGRLFAVVLSLLLIASAVLYVVVFAGGPRGSGPLARGGAPGSGEEDVPAICPLTGTRPEGEVVPNRPALAVKVENLPAARPQTGLSWADVVYEEPVEAGITRFIAVYQCHDAGRIEPVRSARYTDADILRQLGHPLLGYAGAVPRVIDRLEAAGVLALSDGTAPKAFQRDPTRPSPHNLVTSTQGLYEAARSNEPPPQPLFVYSGARPSVATRVSDLHLPFSDYSDVHWRWDASSKGWLRYHGEEPHLLSDGTQVAAKNVVVQVVRIEASDVTDVNGVPSPEVVATGSGRAYIFRNGEMIKATWRRPDLGDVTKFLDSRGAEIPLTPGSTWVELLPTDIPLSAS